MDGEFLRNNRGKGGSGYTDLTEFLLERGQSDQTSPGGWWKKLSQTARVGRH